MVACFLRGEQSSDRCGAAHHRRLPAFDVTNDDVLDVASAVSRGARLPPLILVGERYDELVCHEGHMRLTAYALAGFPAETECLVGIAQAMGAWTQ